MYGPPGDEQRFINTRETILWRYPEITTYEFWNEPVLRHGWPSPSSNTSFAVMTHFLEDRVPLADIWPQQELLSAVFLRIRDS